MTIESSKMDSEEDHRPRYMVFSKMEQIIQEMQHSESGIPVRCQKIFLTTIPCAFTGYDLVEWLIDRFQIEESLEALQLASLLCQHGYLFPVTETKNLNVKDDGTLYRFQTPYFWSSQNWEPDNVDYAIYLAKRTLRNKQRHGLEDHEQAAFNKLQKMLCDKWDFIFMQAEEQVRLGKDRKKADKVVLDSQEKAFWKVHRPPPSSVKSIEEGTKRHFKPSQIAQRKKKNVDTYRKEIEFLQERLQRPRLKISIAVESLLHHSEQYVEHDPFLSQPQPSNPWISEDPTMWVLNTVLCETPTERRVKRWAFNLRELLSDATGRQEFEMFLEKEYSSENIHFYLAVEQLKQMPLSKVPEKVQEIYREYMEPGSAFEINIDSKTMEKAVQCLKDPTRYIFDAAQGHIFLLMKKDSYQRFLRSDQYKTLLANSINPTSKKKLFSFGGKKRSPNPSPKPKRRGSTSSTVANDRKLATNSLSQHSYSTGNLQDLDDRSNKSSPLGSAADIKGEHTERSLSPSSLRRKLDALASRPMTPPGTRNLEVPSTTYMGQTSLSNGEKDEDTLSITVPNTATKLNIVAPWENESDQ